MSGTCDTIGPKLMPSGCALSLASVSQAVGVLAVAVAERPGAQGQVEDPFRPAALVMAADRRAVEALG